MKPPKHSFIIIGALTLIFVGNVLVFTSSSNRSTTQSASSVRASVTLSGTYVCLPYLDKLKIVTEECVFGLLTDDGEYYIVNFDQSAAAKEGFDKRAHITAKGFITLKEALNTDRWASYDMKGIFTVTER